MKTMKMIQRGAPANLDARRATLALLLAAAVGGGCVAEPPDAPVDPACDGKCDGREASMSPALRRLVADARFLELLRAQGAADRQLSLRGVNEEGGAIAIELVSESAVMFPSFPRVEGTLEATLDGDAIAEVRFVAGPPVVAFDDALSPAVGAVLADPRYAKAFAPHVGTPLALRRLLEVPEPAGRTTVVIEVADVLEIVARVEERVERGLRVRSVHAAKPGVVADVKSFTLAERSFFPGNGYFVFDDRDAFLADFWPKLAAVTGLPEPYLGPNDRVVGVVTSFFPYAGKSMSVEAIRETTDATVVEIDVKWDAFGCVELIADVQLWDIIRIPRSDKPVRLVVTTSNGPGCDIGLPNPPPPPPPRVQHDRLLGAGDVDQYFVCDASGRTSDLFTSCAAHNTLD